MVARYVYGVGIDEPVAELQSGTTSYYEADGLGSVTSLTSSAGAIANTYTYDSFGKQTASSGSVTNPFRYTGREFDTETNLSYNRARYFDPSTGRFLSEDPIRLKGGINFYSYTRNNPVNYTDPLGLCPPNDNPEQISCDTVLPDGSTIGSIVSALVNSINDSTQIIDTPEGPYITPDLGSIAGQVFTGTNFKSIFQGFTSPGLPNAQSLGDAGNFAYGAVAAQLGVPLSLTEEVAAEYNFWAHGPASWLRSIFNGAFGMDNSAAQYVPAGYAAQCLGY